ncbi:hypothetical protein RRG08_026004 [Elysia crispata]|uniref:Uncharacterized protein n=1 Tax=Elysia crispata TaxID=231223 RepID=A0AAE1B5L3_9GAST|nr:hypothetical protein RRG08_026004 [Elysia crispata]
MADILPHHPRPVSEPLTKPPDLPAEGAYVIDGSRPVRSRDRSTVARYPTPEDSTLTHRQPVTGRAMHACERPTVTAEQQPMIYRLVLSIRTDLGTARFAQTGFF